AATAAPRPAPFARHASGSLATAAPPSGASATTSGRRYRVATKNAATARTYAGAKADQTRTARRDAPDVAKSARTKPAPASGTRSPGPTKRMRSARLRSRYHGKLKLSGASSPERT